MTKEMNIIWRESKRKNQAKKRVGREFCFVYKLLMTISNVTQG